MKFVPHVLGRVSVDDIPINTPLLHPSPVDATVCQEIHGKLVFSNLVCTGGLKVERGGHSD